MRSDEPEVNSDVFDELPKEMRKVVSAFQSMSVVGMTGPAESSISKKITEEHISKWLDINNEGMHLADKEKSRNHWRTIVIVLVLAVLAAIVLFLYRDQPDMVEKILYAVGGLTAGLFGGYGYGKTKRAE